MANIQQAFKILFISVFTESEFQILFVSSAVIEYESGANIFNPSLTFLETREAKEFDETKVVSSDNDFVFKGSICCVDVVGVSVLLPDAIHLRAQNPSEAVPVDALDLFCTRHLFAHCQQQTMVRVNKQQENGQHPLKNGQTPPCLLTANNKQ